MTGLVFTRCVRERLRESGTGIILQEIAVGFMCFLWLFLLIRNIEGYNNSVHLFPCEPRYSCSNEKPLPREKVSDQDQCFIIGEIIRKNVMLICSD